MDSKGSNEKARVIVNTIILEEKTANILQRIRFLSEDTYEHLLNVAYITAEILIQKCCRQYELYEVTKGALLHDIGKIKTPETILNKAGYLTNDELKTMKNHPADGIECLITFMPNASRIVKDIVYMHHEKPDGSGYPEGEKEIPWYVELVSTVDAYDAMTARRCYGRVRSSMEAIETLKYEGFSEMYISDIACLADK